MVLFAGCSGVLPGGSDDGTSTQTAMQTPGQTSTATPDSAPEGTPTATSKTTPTSTPTPSPNVEDHRLLARQIVTELQKNGAEDESWVRDAAAGAEYSAILVRQPPEWTVKRTEMEVVREAVRGVVLGTEASANPAGTNGSDLHRPEEIRIVVQNTDGEISSRLSLDTELAVAYADKKVSLEEFASRLNNTRKVERNVPLGENSTAHYLKIAEWRQIRDEQIRIINLRENFTVKLDKSELRPERHEIYYYYTPSDSWQRVLREAELLRTYWEAIRNVSRQRLVHRFPERMRLYASVPGGEDVETTIRTEYAFDFIRATNGTVGDENILLNGAYDLYYPKKNVTRYPDR
jgi:hypothetical protein